MSRLRLGFRGRQIAGMTAVAAFVALVTSAISVSLLVHSSIVETRNLAELIGRALYRQATPVIRQHWPDGVDAALATDPGLRNLADAFVGYSPVTVYVAILDARERAMFHSDRSFEGRPVGSEESLAEFSTRNPWVQIRRLATGRQILALDLPFEVDSGGRFGTVRVAVSTVLLREELTGLMLRSAAISAAVVLVAFVVSFYVADRALAPVERLRKELARIDLGEHGPLDLRTEHDASRLASLFSSMARQLKRTPPSEGTNDAAGLSLDLEEGIVVLSDSSEVLFESAAARRILGPCGGSDGIAKSVPPVSILARQAPTQGGEIGPVRLTLRSNDETGDCEARAQPLHVPGGRDVVLVTVRDAQRRARLSAELSHSRALNAVGQISSGVSHEIKNALNAIVMHAELLRIRLQEDVEASRSVEVIEKELRRLDQVFRTFLEFTLPADLSLESVDLQDVIDEATVLVAGQAEASGIRLETRTQQPPRRVRGNAGMLRQALLNLMQNACDAMPDGGTLHVRLEHNVSAGSLLLQVEDTGPGIPSDRRDRIFDLFHSTKEGGAGIGLSVVYRVVHLHGGEIEVESTPGKGSRFTIVLPEEKG